MMRRYEEGKKKKKEWIELRYPGENYYNEEGKRREYWLLHTEKIEEVIKVIEFYRRKKNRRRKTNRK